MIVDVHVSAENDEVLFDIDVRAVGGDQRGVLVLAVIGFFLCIIFALVLHGHDGAGVIDLDVVDFQTVFFLDEDREGFADHPVFVLHHHGALREDVSADLVFHDAVYVFRDHVRGRRVRPGHHDDPFGDVVFGLFAQRDLLLALFVGPIPHRAYHVSDADDAADAAGVLIVLVVPVVFLGRSFLWIIPAGSILGLFRRADQIVGGIVFQRDHHLVAGDLVFVVVHDDVADQGNDVVFKVDVGGIRPDIGGTVR